MKSKTRIPKKTSPEKSTPVTPPSPQFDALEKRIKYNFRDQSLLADALTHPSYKSVAPDARDYQRLEFLGDAVLGLLFAEMLFQIAGDAPEGQLTNARSRLARGSNLATVAKKLDLAAHMRFAPGPDADRIRATESAHEDALEALFGAVFLDGGIRATRALAKRFFADELRVDSASLEQTRSAKNRLQEIIQARGKSQNAQAIEYVVITEDGPQHAKIFTVEVRLNGHLLGCGTGTSKRTASEAAAAEALERVTVDEKGLGS